MASLLDMADIVGKQNIGNANYSNMAPDCDDITYKAACKLIRKGKEQPSGFT